MLISDWLNSAVSDYSKGIKLFEENKGSAVVLRLLYQGKNSFTTSLLEKELRKLIQSPGEEITDLPQPHDRSLSKAPCDTSENSSRDIDEEYNKGLPLTSAKQLNVFAPKQLIDLIKERQQLYRERDYMKAKLPHVRGKTRAEYALKVVANTYMIEDIWNVYDHWKETGVIIDLERSEKKTARAMMYIENEISNARSNVSKHKKTQNPNLLSKWDTRLKGLYKEKQAILDAI